MPKRSRAGRTSRSTLSHQEEKRSRNCMIAWYLLWSSGTQITPIPRLYGSHTEALSAFCSNFYMQMYASTHLHKISLLLLHSRLPQDPRAPLVLHQVHSRVYVIARASIGDGLINQPDQAKGL